MSRLKAHAWTERQALLILGLVLAIGTGFSIGVAQLVFSLNLSDVVQTITIGVSLGFLIFGVWVAREDTLVSNVLSFLLVFPTSGIYLTPLLSLFGGPDSPFQVGIIVLLSFLIYWAISFTNPLLILRTSPFLLAPLTIIIGISGSRILYDWTMIIWTPLSGGDGIAIAVSTMALATSLRQVLKGNRRFNDISDAAVFIVRQLVELVTRRWYKFDPGKIHTGEKEYIYVTVILGIVNSKNLWDQISQGTVYQLQQEKVITQDFRGVKMSGLMLGKLFAQGWRPESSSVQGQQAIVVFSRPKQK